MNDKQIVVSRDFSYILNYNNIEYYCPYTSLFKFAIKDRAYHFNALPDYYKRRTLAAVLHSCNPNFNYHKV